MSCPGWELSCTPGAGCSYCEAVECKDGGSPSHTPSQGVLPTKIVLALMPSVIRQKTQTVFSVMATTAQLVGPFYL